MRRRQLGMELRRLREAAGMMIEEVAQHIGRASSTVSRIETGKSGTRLVYVRALLDLYGLAEGPERQALLELAKTAQLKGWWSAFDDVLNADFERYLGYEGGAASLRIYDNRVVPGLLQTADYARASLRCVRRYDSPEDIERRVELRLKRQELLTGDDPLTLWVVVDEAVLHRAIGGAEVMRAQLAHLLTVAASPTVTVQVLPFGRGGHAGLNGAFTIIEFPEPTDPDVVYVECPAGNLYLEKPREVRRQAGVFNRLLSEALTGEESMKLIESVAEGL